MVNGELSRTKRSFGFGAFSGDHNFDNNYYGNYGNPFMSDGGYHLPDPHHHHHTHSHTLVTKKFGIPVPQPYPVPYPVKVGKSFNFNFFFKFNN